MSTTRIENTCLDKSIAVAEVVAEGFVVMFATISSQNRFEVETSILVVGYINWDNHGGISKMETSHLANLKSVYIYH